MKECILVSNNMVRDAKRDVSRALRESQRDRLSALDAFAQGLERIVNGFDLKEESGRDGAEAVMDGFGTAGPEWQESTEGE